MTEKDHRLGPIDGIIFDMDGTLWDATDSYVESWNLAIRAIGGDKMLNRKDLECLMGLEEKEVFHRLFPDMREEEQKKLSRLCNQKQDEYLPKAGGKLYEGVKEGLRELASHYSLFIVSNCNKNTIPNFIRWAGIENLISDFESHGNTHKSKAENIRLIIKRNKLKFPVYVGDTASDEKSAKEADVPFIHVSYGFGSSESAPLTYDNFNTLTSAFIKKIFIAG
jgi:phosphoglycolate phosphatase